MFITSFHMSPRRGSRWMIGLLLSVCTVGAMAQVVNPNEASPDQVLISRPFWNQKPGTTQYARSNCTMPEIGVFNIMPGTTPKVIPKGFHDGVNSKVAGDADLISTNIRAGVNLFGVVGNPNVVNTTVAPANAAAAGSILAGKSAFANGALVAGTVRPTALATQTAQSAGYYNAFNLATVDPDLVAANIKKGVTLFGVAGSPNVVDTGAGTAVAANLVAGKTAFVKGALVTGTIATRTPSAAQTAQPAGYYNAFNLATVDPDLVAANIKKGVTLFGVAGSPNVVDTGAGTAVPANIVAGKTAFVKGALVTGTMATQTPSAAQAAQSAGYYNAFNLATVDPDLVAGNIKKGVTLFGVAGSDNVVDTDSGDAVAGDILSGKKAWVDGAEVTGTATAGADVTGQNGELAITLPDGLYSGNKKATASDPNLVAGNIKAGATVFGVAGDANVADTGSGDAVTGDILSGKKAWVDGAEVTGTATAGADVTGQNGELAITLPDGLYSGNKKATGQRSQSGGGQHQSRRDRVRGGRRRQRGGHRQRRRRRRGYSLRQKSLGGRRGSDRHLRAADAHRHRRPLPGRQNRPDHFLRHRRRRRPANRRRLAHSALHRQRQRHRHRQPDRAGLATERQLLRQQKLEPSAERCDHFGQRRLRP